MRSIERRTTRTLIAALAGVSLIAAACGGSEEAESETTEAPATTEAAADETDTTEAPADEAEEAEAAETTEAPAEEEEAADGELRIVSLSPTHTEIMFAIGAGDMLVAVDQYSNFPAEAEALPNELSGYEPNIEAIAEYEPDLVLLSSEGAVEQLDALGIDTWVGTAATSFDDVYAQIEQLGAATGHIGEAAEVVSEMQTRIDEIVANAPKPEAPLTYFHEISADGYTNTSDTFIGQQYELLGLTNIAGSADDNDGNQYPQLNAEVIAEANPDLIFLADVKCCGESAETVAARDGWADIAAVQNGNVIEMDDDIASRWGPRIVDYLEAVATAVEAAAVPA